MRTENISILISSTGIPSNKIGSWNIMITDMLEKDSSVFDYIVSPKPDYKIENLVNDTIKKINFTKKIKSKTISNYYLKYNYWKKIKTKLLKNKNLILNVIDDFNMANAIHYFALKEGVRDRIRILFYFHGFYFDVNKFKLQGVFSIDKLILLTDTSYYNLLQKSIEIPFEVAILKNGIKSNYFYQLENSEKIALRKELFLKPNVKYFLWISQDRPKKGLNIILKTWSKLLEKYHDIELLIIGTEKEIKGDNITWLNRKPNKELCRYYQATDYYLFSTLWHEGLPLSLIEALKSGAKCIASDIDPIKEVLHNGNLGLLVDKPNIVNSWVNAVTEVMDGNYDFNKEDVDLNSIYDSNQWIKEFKAIISDA